MDNRTEPTLNQVLETTDCQDDNFFNYGFEESYEECIGNSIDEDFDTHQYIDWGKEQKLSTALQDLDDSLGLLDFN